MTTHILRSAGSAVVVHLPESGVLPQIVHWGADLPEQPEPELRALVDATSPATPHSGLDQSVRPGLLPELSRGFTGTPGIQGFSIGPTPGPQPYFGHTRALDVTDRRLIFEATDTDSRLALSGKLELSERGVLRVRYSLTNIGDTPYALDSLLVSMPLPTTATEVLDLTGRWTRERSPQRREIAHGTWRRDSRHGRTGHDATLLMLVGTPSFGWRHGHVWGVHVAWSGDHTTYVERLPEGGSFLGGGELLAPGEIVLGPGDTYTTPLVHAVTSNNGLDGLSARMHQDLRARPAHPQRPRPVVLNTWEAVYFDHDFERLTALADVAASLGVERFVLDDGWFRHRRDDTRGLGDWYVDDDVWPDGLTPLIDHVTALGLEFGLWIEPEMINPDSDLAREHPDWILAARTELPPMWRNQQVLDLVNADAYAYIRGRLFALLHEHEIRFLKWDHNRDLVDVGHQGRPAVHRQTMALYALLDEIRTEFPRVEIESCSSGGGRVDLAILDRTERVWASDCNDPFERQLIQRWTSLLLPLELIGSHVGPPKAHTTGQYASLAFRAATALFGHFGIEWDIAAAEIEERGELAEWIELYKAERALLHGGNFTRVDQPDDSLWVHGVVSPDRRRALFAAVQMRTSPAAVPGRMRFAGLDHSARYLVAVVNPGGAPASSARPPRWVENAEPLVLTGAALMRVGLELPVMTPQSALVLRLRLVDAPRLNS